ncbi:MULTISPECIES: molybdate ABC transporter permease subunit [Methanosarcina]|jgi:molybdate transport system permease protein|uniref:Molybdenum transport system permease protein ModB n=4 Tax=Methanosarcina mazei TaxID=2209 RepID=A0A0E3LTM6_METMZ|nr:Molybdenum transporter, permease protein [Methanosarcina mazei Go1]AKB63786.1 Molybdenum transport system permease protein ModB [Methanosarcina mazei S-6]AKB67121.1 Molybdenum transport system permease protein ModB [Methanosarcina mazei LYC]UWJ21964.1 Molybdenum transport system permease protein ModB [Methanosarcina mazei TMA]BBL66747.1 molybdenum ABC transporter permease subunit [Methanosarcina mazei]
MEMFQVVMSPLLLTLKIAAVSTFFVTFLGILIAYVLAKKEFSGKWLADALVTLPLILPPTVTGYILVILLGKNGILGNIFTEITGKGILFTWQAAAIAAFVVSLPLMVKTAASAIGTVDRSVEEAARILGRNELETALFITLPLAKKGVIAGCILSFARAVGEFGATLMVAGNIPGKTGTMPLSIYGAYQTGNNELASLLVIVLVAISFLTIAATSRLAEK